MTATDAGDLPSGLTAIKAGMTTLTESPASRPSCVRGDRMACPEEQAIYARRIAEITSVIGSTARTSAAFKEIALRDIRAGAAGNLQQRLHRPIDCGSIATRGRKIRFVSLKMRERRWTVARDDRKRKGIDHSRIDGGVFRRRTLFLRRSGKPLVEVQGDSPVAAPGKQCLGKFALPLLRQQRSGQPGGAIAVQEMSRLIVVANPEYIALRLRATRGQWRLYNNQTSANLLPQPVPSCYGFVAVASERSLLAPGPAHLNLSTTVTCRRHGHKRRA